MDTLRLIDGKMLRKGYTTGSCATAAAKAATIMLLTQQKCPQVMITTPKGDKLTLDVWHDEFDIEYASCAIQKDSGDDPDITNGVLVYAKVTFSGKDITLRGGEGIGLVTKPGLDQPVGSYAINNTPRQMIHEACLDICQQHNYIGGLNIEISIPGGAELAEHTFNPRLGIIGGLSILGTSGIVEPMSQAAIVETIRAELSLIRATGKEAVLLTVGNYSETFAENNLSLKLNSHVKCSNFIGESLAAAAELGFKRALLIGHIGKLVKLGIGITNTHSNHGDGRMETLIACALEAGATLDTLLALQACVSTDAALDCLTGSVYQITLDLLARRVTTTLQRHVAAHLQCSFICFSGLGNKMKLCFQSPCLENIKEDFH